MCVCVSGCMFACVVAFCAYVCVVGCVRVCAYRVVCVCSADLVVDDDVVSDRLYCV